MDIGEPAVDPNTLTRIVQVTSAFDEVLKHPFLGGGTSSFQLAFDWQSLGEEWEDQGWIGNTEMRVLHDTGIIGLVIFAAFLVSLYRRSRKALKSESNPELVALSGVCPGLLCFISSHRGHTAGFFLGTPWAHRLRHINFCRLGEGIWERGAARCLRLNWQRSDNRGIHFTI